MAGFNTFKTDPISLLSLKRKFVKLELTKNLSINGFVYAIDPEQFSIILLEPSGESFKTILIPGHAIVEISEIQNRKFPVLTTKATVTNLLQKKQRLISWLKLNLLPVVEEEDNILFGSVTILPPYDVTNIYSTSPIVANQVKELLERMPDDF